MSLWYNRDIQIGILKEEKHMTKEQIIGALKAAAKPYEEYYIDDEVMEAIIHILTLTNL